jgi:hypothetical protein
MFQKCRVELPGYVGSIGDACMILVASLIFSQHQKQYTKSKTAMPHSPRNGSRQGHRMMYGIRKNDIPVNHLYRDFQSFDESYGFRECVLEGKDKDSLYRHQYNELK